MDGQQYSNTVTTHGTDGVQNGAFVAFQNENRHDTFPFSKSSSQQNSSSSDNNYAIAVARRGQDFAARKTRRLITKDGECKIQKKNIDARHKHYCSDAFTTIIEFKWRYIWILFILLFVITWFLYAALWYAIVVAHGDHLHNASDADVWKPCISGVYDFSRALLFSIETQQTIGYGYHHMEPECPETYVILMAQTCTGVLIPAIIMASIFVKLSQPKQRAHTLMFSRNAVICLQDNNYRFLIRVADMRKSYVLDTTVRLFLVDNHMTREGETIRLRTTGMKLDNEINIDKPFVFLAWPAVISHTIDENSPLWTVSADNLLTKNFEIIVFLEGVVEATGMVTQARTSYLPSEILWGHRLSPFVGTQKGNKEYIVDYSHFHETRPSEMPECSAKDYSKVPVRTDRSVASRSDYDSSLEQLSKLQSDDERFDVMDSAL